MYRVSTHLSNNDVQFYLRRREYVLNRLQNQLSSGERITDLRDDPTAAIEAVRLDSYLNRLSKFKDNVAHTEDHFRLTEGKITEAVEIMQRIRELTVQISNGIYTQEDRDIAAVEVNQLLNEVVSVANSEDGTGRALFGGTYQQGDPFRVQHGRVDGAIEQHIVSVSYQGNIGSRKNEISENVYIDVDMPGNQLFWSQNQQIFSTTDAREYRALQDSVITIDNHDISITAGDTVNAVIYKINQSPTAVRASLDSTRNALTLTTTEPHQLWIEESGTVLQDLGIIDGGERSSADIASSAEVFGSTVFDDIISLRDALYANDSGRIGGQILGAIDSSLNNVLTHLAGVGAKDTRLQFVAGRLEHDIPEITEAYALAADTDFTDAIVRLRAQENGHQAALAVAGRVLPQTLLDFIR